MNDEAVIADTLRQLVLANRIMAREGVIDDFGHVSVRSPVNPARYFLSRARSPEIVVRDDLIEFTLEGDPVQQPETRTLYRERALHGAVYMARPDVNAVVHHHARAVLPFTLTNTPMRPVFHMASVIGHQVPLWDSQAEFGDTDMLIDDLPKGQSMARALGDNTCVLLRGHGATCVGASLPAVVFISNYMKENAELILQTRQLGEPQYLSAGEIDKTAAMLMLPRVLERGWDYRVARAGFRGL